MTGSGHTRVWDPFVRIVHWLLLVVAFFTAYFVEPEESSIHRGCDGDRPAGRAVRRPKADNK